MTVVFSPSVAAGELAAPPSKSVTHRALIAAALAGGDGIVENMALSDDTFATVDCLRALGARIAIDGHTAVATPLRPETIADGVILPCRESGTTLRLLIPFVLTLEKEIAFTGSGRLFLRPLSAYEELCRDHGLLFARGKDCLTVRGPLSSGRYAVPGDVTSQFISGLCMALPLLRGDSRIILLPPVESRPYIELTARMLAHHGVEARFSRREIFLPGGQRYSPRNTYVEGDWSNAAFPAALNLLGGSVRITGLSEDSCQADRVFPAYFDALQKGTPTLALSDCPDLGPVCFALAAALQGAAFTGVHRLRYKETDRISAMGTELSKLGAALSLQGDTLTVHPSPLRPPAEPLFSHNDHRIAMALSVLLSRTGGILYGAEAVGKSYPDFYDRLEELGVRLTRYF